MAALEIVSPANKDRPEHRNDFIGECAALLQKGVAVSIVELVATRHFNLYAEDRNLTRYRTGWHFSIANITAKTP